MSKLEFKKFGSIKRLNRDCTITEKVDGTNGLIAFANNGDILVGSRKREIFPEGTLGQDKGCDNFGFAKWAYNNREELFNYLGEGYHYGEWAGKGIQRGYGEDKKFYLFNTFRHKDIPSNLVEAGLAVVPVLYEGPFDTRVISEEMKALKEAGSSIGKDSQPEGVVVYHHASHSYFKVTYEHDATGKL
jgi:hypothetical protein